MSDCIFCSIAHHDVTPLAQIYEDDFCIAILDIMPTQKGHMLVIPKKHSSDFLDTTLDVLHHTLGVTQKIARAAVNGLGADGFNVSTNNGQAAGQVIFHLHWHVIPRFNNDGLRMWPGTKYQDGEAESIADKIRKALICLEIQP